MLLYLYKKKKLYLLINLIFTFSNIFSISQMKNILFTLTFLICVVCTNQNIFAHAFRQNNVNFCASDNNAFEAGESLSYKIHYTWGAMRMNAGKATFKLSTENLNGKNVFHAVSEGRSAAGFDWFFKVRDRYDSYFDMQKIKPLKFVRDVKEGSYTKYTALTFYHDQSKVLITKNIRQGHTENENKTYKIGSCTQDLLSLMYYARCVDYSNLNLGDYEIAQVFLDGEIYDIKVQYLGRETVKTELGTFRCVKFSPQLIAGDVFSGQESMYVWVTDDANKIPVKIESPLSVGFAKITIASASGLRNAMTAKVVK